MRIRRFFQECESGQALLETALILPMMLGIVFNAVNFGQFFLVAINVAAAPKTAALYSVMGFATPGDTALGSPLDVPDASPTSTNTTVAYLVYNDLNGALASSTSATSLSGSHGLHA